MKFVATFGPEKLTFHAVDIEQARRKAIARLGVPKAKHHLVVVKAVE